ncbi:MAG TPA: DUF2911 domain-containing protein [Polyangia bacterium]|jgi:tetratricopeptide (TPR) repeat protein
MKIPFRSSLASLACVALFVGSAPAFAALELPKPSPSAKVTQTVGLTEISVEYSSPAVRGRKIWGGLVPYGQVWRTGANAATKITFSKDVTVGNRPIAAGSYALFAIPGAKSWTIILNKDFNEVGAFSYKKDLDVLRLEVKPQAIPFRERLVYLISDFTDNSASVDLEWEKLRVAIPVKMATSAEAQANIKALTDTGWMPYNAAAHYLLAQKSYAEALKLVDQSLALKEDWQNVWTKAQILAGEGHYREAYPLAERAQALGAKAERFFDADQVKKALTDWKGKR